ncbi:uncharacterized protein BT62DRAFT_928815 [Guyanagaster necrorhizus]|uniref:Uncharacterized protein n=1 Tax=Guyanagaster necrorhizus TaxID=856835 RepID=A0A9P7W0A3_9AGAR|nr:uncharacterized protein BT62DRAFT_928815 [Guyanagaster necrorhizus MCA 3950]KAG7450025.1 hypothetical protein BT62DRAFT_928815 [Guyanagaster necrorhizus MCA 3950]
MANTAGGRSRLDVLKGCDRLYLERILWNSLDSVDDVEGGWLYNALLDIDKADRAF